MCTVLHTVWKSWFGRTKLGLESAGAFPYSLLFFPFYLKSLTWNLRSKAGFPGREYAFNTAILLSGWENVSWQMQRNKFIKKRCSGFQRHLNRTYKVLSVLSTYRKGAVLATVGESALIKLETMKRPIASHFCNFMKLWQSFT